MQSTLHQGEPRCLGSLRRVAERMARGNSCGPFQELTKGAQGSTEGVRSPPGAIGRVTWGHPNPSLYGS